MKEVVLGIDIGGTNCLIGLVDESGNILHETNLSTKSIPNSDSFFKLLAQELKKTASDFKILGAGIGAPNANYYTQTIDNAPNLNWGKSIPFGEMFSKHFDYSLVLTNDANAAAMGEKRFGGAKNMKDFIVITLGTGLGSGFVVNNKIVYGHSGMAGELGHINVNPKGRFCACGRRGCLETYLSATGIKRTVYKLLADYTEDSILRDISYNTLTSKMVTEAAQEGDFIAIKAFEYTGKMLGLKLADTVLHTSPEAIFLFGGLVRAGEHLFVPTLKHMEKKMMDTFKGTVKVLPSELLDKNAAVLGAAALAWDEVK